MFRRIWCLETMKGAAESKITIYDFGGYCGEMIGDMWSCWKIHSRTMNEAGEIVEELEAMPQDWVPFDSFTRETYRGITQKGGFQIRGWSVLTEPLEGRYQSEHISYHSVQPEYHHRGQRGQQGQQGQQEQGHLRQGQQEQGRGQSVLEVQELKLKSLYQNDYNSTKRTVKELEQLNQHSVDEEGLPGLPELPGLPGQTVTKQDQPEQQHIVLHNSTNSKKVFLPKQQGQQQRHQGHHQGQQQGQQQRHQGQQQRHQGQPAQKPSSISQTKILQPALAVPIVHQSHLNQPIQTSSQHPTPEMRVQQVQQVHSSLKAKKTLNSVSTKENKYRKIHTAKQIWTPLVQTP